MLWAIGTRKLVGKDTAAQYLCRKYLFKKIAFANALKIETKIILDVANIDYNPYDEEEKAVFRPFLIAYGILRRHFDPDYWVNKIITPLKDQIRQDPGQNWVITDLRYENEAEALKKLGAVLIRINRNIKEELEPTEKDGDNIKVDYEIDNNGTINQLEKEIDKIWQKENQSSTLTVIPKTAV